MGPTINNEDSMLRLGIASVIRLQSIDLHVLSFWFISLAHNRWNGTTWRHSVSCKLHIFDAGQT